MMLQSSDDGRGSGLGEFGDKFRKARESKELSLDDVSSVTKISARMLQAIEEEHFDQLPGGVFNKGFIRAYAKHLGLNSEDAVTDYLACLRQAQIDAQQVWQPERLPPASVRPASSRHTFAGPPGKAAVTPQAPVEVEELPDLQLPRPDRVQRRAYPQRLGSGIPWKLAAVAALIIILALLVWMRYSQAPQAASTQSTPAPAAAPSPAPLRASVPPSPAQPRAASPVPRPRQPSAADTATRQPANPDPSQTAPASTSMAAPAPAADAGNVGEKVVQKGDVTIRSFGQPAATSATQSASLSLVIRASETSWISVTSDGQLVAQETLIAPANTTVHAAREIVVRIGNAAGVTFLWNGEEFPAQGAEAEVKTLVFDHAGMRVQAPQ